MSIPEIYSIVLMLLTQYCFMQYLVFGARLFLVFIAHWPSFQTAVPYRRRLRVRRVCRRLQNKSRTRLRDLLGRLVRAPLLSLILASSPSVVPVISHKNLASRETK